MLRFSATALAVTWAATVAVAAAPSPRVTLTDAKQVLDALTDKILIEADKAKRDAMIKEAYQLSIDDFGYIPLHQQALAWGVSKKVKLAQRADNAVNFQYAIKE